jgi:hypothetical protein
MLSGRFNMKKKEEPFFARYLEGQKFPQVKTNIKAGPTTQKYPSDADEDMTLKFPSDAEDSNS